MVSPYLKAERRKKTSLNVDKETSSDLGVLAAKEGLTKKELVRKLTKHQQEACTH